MRQTLQALTVFEAQRKGKTIHRTKTLGTRTLTLQAGHKSTEALRQKVCGVAQQMGEPTQGVHRANDIGDPVMERLFQIAPGAGAR